MNKEFFEAVQMLETEKGTKIALDKSAEYQKIKREIGG